MQSNCVTHLPRMLTKKFNFTSVVVSNFEKGSVAVNLVSVQCRYIHLATQNQPFDTKENSPDHLPISCHIIRKVIFNGILFKNPNKFTKVNNKILK